MNTDSLKQGVYYYSNKGEFIKEDDYNKFQESIIEGVAVIDHRCSFVICKTDILMINERGNYQSCLFTLRYPSNIKYAATYPESTESFPESHSISYSKFIDLSRAITNPSRKPCHIPTSGELHVARCYRVQVDRMLRNIGQEMMGTYWTNTSSDNQKNWCYNWFSGILSREIREREYPVRLFMSL